MTLFANRYFLVFLGLYVLAVTQLVSAGTYSIAEPLFVLFIFGISLPLIAHYLTRNCQPLPARMTVRSVELLVTLIYVAFLAVYLVWGSDLVDRLVYSVIDETPQFDFFLVIGKKVLIFVALPYLIFSRWFGYSWSDFGVSSQFKRVFQKRNLLLMAVMFVLYFLIQFLIGQAAQPLFDGSLPALSVILASLFLYPLLMIEVGLVEEFFFRAILQTQLSAWLNSEVAGVFMMALIFGLAHAPGLYLRGAGSVTALGNTPDLLLAISYSIAILALAGLAFGVIWARTRNLLVLIMIHAWVDLLPTLPEFIEIFEF
jgi:membrane protease YdiL (CAAX protease family)